MDNSDKIILDEKDKESSSYQLQVLELDFFLQLKQCQKKCFPIIDKPLVQYAVEEAIEIGIEEIIFITSPSKYSIKKHFDKSKELEEKLRSSGKDDLY